MPLCLLLALSIASCDSDKSATPPVPAPERAEATPKEATSAEAKAAAQPSGDPAAQAPTGAAAPSGAPESGQAAAAPTGAASAEAAAAGTGTAGKGSALVGAPPADTGKAAAPAKGAAAAGGTSAPKTANGILGPGAADKILKAGSRPLVKLVAPGAEPREVLTYALDKGVKQSLGMGMDMVMSLKMGQSAMPPMAIPRMVMNLDMTVGDKDAGGDWKIDAALLRVGLEPKGEQQQQMATQMQPHVDSMKGLTMTYFVTPKGHVHDVKINVPPGFPAQAQQMLTGMNQSFESMVAPLPNEPVGIGGKWEVTTRVVSSGADLLQFAVYTLKEKAGSKATLDVTVTQVAASEKITAPGMPAGATARLKRFSSGGTGTNKLDVKSATPEGGRMNVKTGMDLEVSLGAGGAEATSVETTLAVEFTRPKG
jgi:hypothetical protein